MWKIIPLLILISTEALGQEAPKKATTIKVITTDKLEEVFQKYEKYLDDEGYIIRNKENLISLQTSLKEKSLGPMSSYSVYVEYLLEFKQMEDKTSVTITGNYADNGGMSKSKAITNKGSSNFGVGLAWRIMNELAIRYPGGQISYSME
ncbi:MAG TPA: hypothetical protein VGA21_13460 [Cyclobacteriaceae bacterium]|jgi:hypothetical protein